MIPQNNPYKVTVDRQSLIGALRRVSIFSSQASSLIKLRLSNNQITISAQDIDFSTSAEETQTCQYDGNDMSIGFKSTFLLDILNNISAEEVVIELADPSRAGSFARRRHHPCRAGREGGLADVVDANDVERLNKNSPRMSDGRVDKW